MLFGYFTLLVALIIETVGAYYSITGLAAIFSGAVIPILIMGASLEVGKVTAAVWLKTNWERASITYKLYLVPAVAFLMILTSMGIFGFLSKAHSDQSLVSGDSQAKVSIYDEKIRTAKDNIETNRRALKQMDEAVDQVMARSTDEKGADKAVAIRRGQQKERQRLLSEIDAEQKKISQYNEEVAPLRAEFRKVEADVGPIKYIAALIYGDNPDANVLERAVRWVIILIVAVFDPLALVLILAAQQSLRWAKNDSEQKQQFSEWTDDDFDDFSKDTWVADLGEPPTEEESTINLSDVAVSHDPHPVGWMYGPQTENKVKEESILDKHPYLSKKFEHFKNLKPIVAKPEVEPVVEAPVIVESLNAPGLDASVERPGDYLTSPPPAVPETAPRHKEPMPKVPETLNIRKLQADNVESHSAKSSFGIAFPIAAEKGDLFLRVDYYPNRLFKFNGVKWIEVDKNKTDSYTYDDQYIDFLIEKLKSGEYEIDQLSSAEQELVEQKLQKLNDNT